MNLKLSASQIELVKGALRDIATRKGSSARRREIMLQICSAPELRQRSPEDVLIAFKRGLSDAASDRGITLGADRNDLLARLVSEFIEELFRAKGPSDGWTPVSADPSPQNSRTRAGPA